MNCFSVLPNEIMLDIFSRLNPADVNNVRNVDLRFRTICDHFELSAPIASSLSIIRPMSHHGGWLHKVDILAKVRNGVFTTHSGIRKINYDELGTGIHTNDDNTSEETMVDTAEALRELKISGTEILELDRMTMQFNLEKIQEIVGMDFGRLHTVRFPHDLKDFTEYEPVLLPFITDDILLKVMETKTKQIHYHHCLTSITTKGVIQYLKARMSKHSAEVSNFGIIRMATYDHASLQRFLKKMISSTPSLTFEKKVNAYVIKTPFKTIHFTFITIPVKRNQKRKATDY